nr:hypothetical protein [Tanacetum cinerariifolium]
MLTMEQYLAWAQDDIRPGVVKPKSDNDIKFENNSNFMRELRCKLFKGTDDEDAHEHVQRVLDIVDLFHFPGVTHDVVILRAFPITLKGPSLRWMNRLSAGEKTIMGKGNVKEPIPHDLPIVPPAQFLSIPYRPRETIYAIGIPEEI